MILIDWGFFKLKFVKEEMKNASLKIPQNFV